MTQVILITAAAGIGGTGAGGMAVCFFRRNSERAISLLLRFAAGVMTAVVCFDLLTDALIKADAGTYRQLGVIMAGVLAGYTGIQALNLLIHTQPAGTSAESQKLLLAGWVTAAAIALHNIPEGMVIGASFAAAQGSNVLPRDGLAIAAVIGLHNIPEGMAVAVPLLSGKMRRVKTVLITAVTGIPTMIGAALGYFLGTMGPLALTLCLSGASGAMLCVVFGELLPEANELWHSGLATFAVILGMLVGLTIVSI